MTVVITTTASALFTLQILTNVIYNLYLSISCFKFCAVECAVNPGV